MSKALFSWYEKHAQSGQQVESIAQIKPIFSQNISKMLYHSPTQSEIQTIDLYSRELKIFIKSNWQVIEKIDVRYLGPLKSSELGVNPANLE